jgi:hypothetical protein
MQEKEGKSHDFSQEFVIQGAASRSLDTTNGQQQQQQHASSEHEPMRISLDFGQGDDNHDDDIDDDIVDDFNEDDGDAVPQAELNSADNEQLNDDMGLLVIGTGLRPNFQR